MKLKILMLVILLMLLLTANGFTQIQEESLNKQDNVFGIDAAQFYLGELVLELLLAAEAEIEIAVDEAYAEGYKAAMLEYAPRASMAELLQTELEKERNKSKWFWPAVGATFGVSFVSGFFLHSVVVR
jgi:hypothetical protein